jgi:potassium efflux system protein
MAAYCFSAARLYMPGCVMRKAKNSHAMSAKAIKLHIRLLLLFLLGNLLLSAPTYAADKITAATPLVVAATQQISLEKARNALFAKRLQVLQRSVKQKPMLIDGGVLRRADLTVAIAQQDIDSINLILTAIQQADALTQNNIQALQGQLQSNELLITTENQADKLHIQLQTQLLEQQTMLALQDQRIKILQNTQSLASQTLEAAQEWKARLQTAYQLQQASQRQQALDALAKRLQQEQDTWLKQLLVLNQQLQKTDNTANVVDATTYTRLEMGIFEAGERSNLNQVQLDLARMHNSLENLAILPEQTHSVTTLNNAQQQASNLLDRLSEMNSTLRHKIDQLQRRRQINVQELQSGTFPAELGHANLGLLNELLARYKEQLTSASNLLQQANTYQVSIAEKLKQQLASRQGLPTDRVAWLMLGQKLVQIPMLSARVLQDLHKIAIQAVVQATWVQWILSVLFVLGWGVAWSALRRYLSAGFITHPVLSTAVRLTHRHLFSLMLLVGLLGLLTIFDITWQSFSLIIDLALVILLFRLMLSLAQLLLLESITDKGGHDVRLYNRLWWILFTGSWITLLTVWVQELPVAYEVQALFARLFMLFLLLVAVVLFKSWMGLPALLESYLENKRPYLRQVVRWLTLLVPLTIFSNALVGLLGYVQLAWSMAAYEGVFLIILTIYLLVRGLLGELARFASEQLIRRTRNGWLWSEAVLKPAHWVLRIILLFVALAVLFGIYGWGQKSWVITHLDGWLDHKLFILGGSVISTASLLQLAILIAVFVWAARWTREFAYRWLFVRVEDLGLRNSLAIFSQYTIVAVGVIIGLRISGINLTALTVVASLFAAGIGFGLRDLANNFMCGILLLIERPVEKGDYVTIGGFEGEVKHIGMRSIMVTTDDHQELLVPNANVFSQPFVNWTHQDNTVRTVIVLKINRIDDPHRVQEIIYQVLKSLPKILVNPPPEVYFKELSEVLLKFQVGYYVDMRSIVSLSYMRSQVLYALWDRFQAEGIQPPDVVHEVHIQGPLQEAQAKT